MSTISRPFDPDLPKAFGGCSCMCHRMPGVKHIMACCYPGKPSIFDAYRESVDDKPKEKADE